MTSILWWLLTLTIQECLAAPEVTEQHLQQVFSTAGTIQSVKLCRDPVTGLSLGYGFINYHSPEVGKHYTIWFGGGLVKKDCIHSNASNSVSCLHASTQDSLNLLFPKVFLDVGSGSQDCSYHTSAPSRSIWSVRGEGQVSWAFRLPIHWLEILTRDLMLSTETAALRQKAIIGTKYVWLHNWEYTFSMQPDQH